jgi:hypothetical protein
LKEMLNDWITYSQTTTKKRIKTKQTIWNY